jgi:hypothetical protein
MCTLPLYTHTHPYLFLWLGIPLFLGYCLCSFVGYNKNPNVDNTDPCSLCDSKKVEYPMHVFGVQTWLLYCDGDPPHTGRGTASGQPYFLRAGNLLWAHL